MVEESEKKEEKVAGATGAGRRPMRRFTLRFPDESLPAASMMMAHQSRRAWDGVLCYRTRASGCARRTHGHLIRRESEGMQ